MSAVINNETVYFFRQRRYCKISTVWHDGVMIRALDNQGIDSRPFSHHVVNDLLANGSHTCVFVTEQYIN